MYNNILVALDNSEFADRVMAEAIELAKTLNGKLTAVAVVDYSVMTYVDVNGPVVMPEVLEAIRDSYEIVLNKCRAEAEKAGVHFQQETLTGNPAGRILEYADDNGVDLIILGHIGRSAASQFLLGSVSHKVSNYAKCSVLIIK